MRALTRSLSPARFVALVVSLIVLGIVGVCLLPHSRYVQYSALHDSSVVKAGWIYERIHFDPTPIDVMFLGTSHTVFGVDSARVEDAYDEATGQHLHAVNFAMQHLGRDIEYVIAREALETRPVKILVIEAPDDEPRSLHPAFSELATPRELLDAPILINPLYLDNLARLPLRQLSLFFRSYLPAWSGTNDAFNPAAYRGSNWDDTYEERGSVEYPVPNPEPRLRSQPPAVLEQERVHYEKLTHDKLSLPGSLSQLEYRANLAYVQRIVALAQQHGVAVHFLYLPGYHAPETPRFVSFYRHLGRIWYPDTVYDNTEYWNDVNHLNYRGAGVLSHWLGLRLAEQLGGEATLVATHHP